MGLLPAVVVAVAVAVAAVGVALAAVAGAVAAVAVAAVAVAVAAVAVAAAVAAVAVAAVAVAVRLCGCSGLAVPSACRADAAAAAFGSLCSGLSGIVMGSSLVDDEVRVGMRSRSIAARSARSSSACIFASCSA